MYKHAIVGFSVNPELELAVEDTPGPKKVLRKIDFCLSGSSGNVAMALKKMGSTPRLLGLTGPGFVVPGCHETLADHLLCEAVDQSEIRFMSIKALTQTNICVIPVIGQDNGVSWGKRNRIVHSDIPGALEDIYRVWDILKAGEVDVESTFSIVTGLRAVEVVFAKALLSKARFGFRVLNAKDTLCRSREFKKVLPLVDLLVLNKREFDETGKTLSELHNHGPRIIVVTHDKKGGMFSFRWACCQFKAINFPGGKFETGAGDWFLGALVSELMRLQVSVSTVTKEEFQGAVDFAARVAGKKITMAGGGNGPTRAQLR